MIWEIVLADLVGWVGEKLAAIWTSWFYIFFSEVNRFFDSLLCLRLNVVDFFDFEEENLGTDIS